MWVDFFHSKSPTILLACGLHHSKSLRHDRCGQVIDKSKLVYAVGWFNAQHNLQNISKADHVIGSSPSFCQAASLAQHPGVVKHMDASGTWVFDRTDPAGAGFRAWYDDEASLGPKYAMVREAGWGGVGMWLANGARRFLPAITAMLAARVHPRQFCCGRNVSGRPAHHQAWRVRLVLP